MHNAHIHYPLLKDNPWFFCLADQDFLLFPYFNQKFHHTLIPSHISVHPRIVSHTLLIKRGCLANLLHLTNEGGSKIDLMRSTQPLHSWSSFECFLKVLCTTHRLLSGRTAHYKLTSTVMLWLQTNQKVKENIISKALLPRDEFVLKRRGLPSHELQEAMENFIFPINLLGMPIFCQMT